MEEADLAFVHQYSPLTMLYKHKGLIKGANPSLWKVEKNKSNFNFKNISNISRDLCSFLVEIYI